MKEKNFTCIVCPKSCGVTVRPLGEGLEVTGNECRRGAEYAENEYLHPMRTITSTVKLTGGAICRCPVRSNAPMPKNKMFEVMEEINRVCVSAPVKVGQVLIPDVLGTGADIIATRTIK